MEIVIVCHFLRVSEAEMTFKLHFCSCCIEINTCVDSCFGFSL